MTKSISKLLIANRGEIAARVIRTAHALGIATVAVYSDPDADAPYVTLADEAVRLPGAAPARTYLRGEAIIAAATHTAADAPTPYDTPDAKTGKTELQRLVEEIRQTAPPARDASVAASPDGLEGEKLFSNIGCAVCHVATYKTLPAGTRINGGTYKIPRFIGKKVIHPYSDFLLHDVGTGDGIPQAAKPEYLDQSTANKFRTPPLWGLRFRYGMMHDGNSTGSHQAIMRHSGEATTIRQRYERLTPAEKEQLQTFLSSL